MRVLKHFLFPIFCASVLSLSTLANTSPEGETPPASSCGKAAGGGGVPKFSTDEEDAIRKANVAEPIDLSQLATLNQFTALRDEVKQVVASILIERLSRLNFDTATVLSEPPLSRPAIPFILALTTMDIAPEKIAELFLAHGFGSLWASLATNYYALEPFLPASFQVEIFRRAYFEASSDFARQSLKLMTPEQRRQLVLDILVEIRPDAYKSRKILTAAQILRIFRIVKGDLTLVKLVAERLSEYQQNELFQARYKTIGSPLLMFSSEYLRGILELNVDLRMRTISFEAQIWFAALDRTEKLKMVEFLFKHRVQFIRYSRFVFTNEDHDGMLDVMEKKFGQAWISYMREMLSNDH